MDERKLFETLQNSESLVIELPSVPNLDVLCTAYLIKSFINESAELISSPESKFKIVAGDTEINLAEIAEVKNLTPSKYLYSCMVKNSEKLIRPFTHNILKLVDYCSRAVMKNLNKQERKPGSFVYVIYGIRNFVSLEELYSVFSYLSDRVMMEPSFLTTMCDIELYLYNQELADKINKSAVEAKELIAKKVRFAKLGDKHWIAFNYSDINLAKTLFLHNRDLILYVYFNDVTGMIFKKTIQEEIIEKIINKIREHYEVTHKSGKHVIIGKAKKEEDVAPIEDLVIDAVYETLKDYELL